MVLGTVVDSNVLSYPMLVIMKEQGAVIGRGRACPQTSGEAEPASAIGRGGASPLPSSEVEPALRCCSWQSLPSAIGRGEACPQTSGEVEPIFSLLGKKSSCVLVCLGASTFDGYWFHLIGYPSIRSSTVAPEALGDSNRITQGVI